MTMSKHKFRVGQGKATANEWGKYVREVMQQNKVVFAIWYTNDDDRQYYCIKGMDTPEGARVE